MNSARNRRPRTLAAALIVVFLAVFLWRLISKNESVVDTPPHVPAAETPVEQHAAEPVSQSVVSSDPWESEYYDVRFEQPERLAEFIGAAASAAEDGDADAQYRLSAIYGACYALVSNFSRLDQDALAAQRLMLSHRMKQSFERDLAFARACESVGETELLRIERDRWFQAALQTGHPVAAGSSALRQLMAGLRSDNPRRVKDAGIRLKSIVSQSRHPEVITRFGAAITELTGAETGLEQPESIAWEMVACDYAVAMGSEYCERSFLIESLCNLRGDHCYPGISVTDYFLVTNPEVYDQARARADEIRMLIENERWEELGL